MPSSSSTSSSASSSASSPVSAARSPWTRAAATLLLILALDQVTKLLVRHGIEPGQSNPIFPAVDLVHVRNTGVAFGFFPGGGALVLAATAGAVALLLAYFVRHPGRPWLWLPTGLLLGGAVGNLVDRLRDGAVTDFVKVPLWPAFNVADMAITVGVLALLWVLEGPRRPRRS